MQEFYVFFLQTCTENIVDTKAQAIANKNTEAVEHMK